MHEVHDVQPILASPSDVPSHVQHLRRSDKEWRMREAIQEGEVGDVSKNQNLPLSPEDPLGYP